MADAEFHQHRYVRELDRLVEVGSRWLDIGAGRKIHDGWEGASCEELADRAELLAGCDVGDDVLSNPYLHEARIADAAELPWADGIFDVVSANMVVEHLEEPVAVFREVHRVLRPDGAFVFVTPHLRYPVVRLASIFIPPYIRRLYAIAVEGRAATDVFPTIYRCNTVEDARSVSDAAGFTVEILEPFRNAVPILPGVLGRLESGLAREGADLIGVLRKPA